MSIEETSSSYQLHINSKLGIGYFRIRHIYNVQYQFFFFFKKYFCFPLGNTLLNISLIKDYKNYIYRVIFFPVIFQLILSVMN